MRFLVKNLTAVYVKPYSASNVKGDISASFGTARAVKMNLQPASKPATLTEYGIKPNEALIALTTDQSIAVLDGVCVDVANTSEPDYQVAVVLKWPSYKKLILQKKV